MNPTTLTSRGAAAVVAVVAGYSSWNHIVEVARTAGEDSSVANVLPLSIDGLIVVGTMAMVADKRGGRSPRLSARVALGFGVVATLAANIASAQPTVTARLVAAVPAVAFLIAVEVLARAGRPTAHPAPVEAEPPAVVDTPAERITARRELPIIPLAALHSATSAEAKPARKASRLSSEQRVIAAHRRTPTAKDAELAARLKISERTVQRYRRPLLAVDTSSPAKPADASINGSVPDLVRAEG